MRRGLCSTMVLGVLLAVIVSAPRAWGATPHAGFAIESSATPTIFSVEHNQSATPDGYFVTVTNAGSLATNGTAIMIRDSLPAALTAVKIEGTESMSCSVLSVTCVFEGSLPPGGVLRVRISVSVVPGATGPVTNIASVSGGGAPGVSTSESTAVGSNAESLAVPYGLESFTLHANGVDGLTDTQAADHPYEATGTFTFNSTPDPASGRYPVAGGLGGEEAAVKDVVVDLPAGFLGNPDVIEKCPQAKVPNNECPAATQIGVARGTGEGVTGLQSLEVSRIYNVIPDRGFPAQFEFSVVGVAIVIHATVNPDTNYGVRLSVADIPAVAGFHGERFTFFGTPLTDANIFNSNRALSSGAAPLVFLENPTGCTTQPQDASVSTDSWQHPGAMLLDGEPDLSNPNWVRATTTLLPQVAGCDFLQFNPSLSVMPDTTQADEPAGVTVDLHLPQAPLLAPDLGTPALMNTTVTLPSGMSLSPSAGDGLAGCSDAQIGLSSASVGSCPLASQVGTVKVMTPLLAEPLEGQVFLGTPNCDPCSNADASDGNMFRLFLQIKGSGVVVKKEGRISANTTTGQLTATFSGIPEVPVTDVQVKFNSGLRAGLATPQSCGTFISTSDLTPWSAPVTPDATPESPFNVDWDGSGGACPGVMPFSPSFSAGTSNPNAGQSSPLTVTFDRQDREQDIAGIQVQMPPGLLGSLTGIPLCGEPQADLGTCSAASRIGSMTVAAGPGAHPFYAQGSLFLTGSYKGAPFGLSIVVPTIAGPFNLGNVVVRARVNIDLHSTALTVTTDPLPPILDGIPLRLRTANVTVNRPGFIFNPTNCAQLRITATVTGAQGAQTQKSAPFAVAGCAGLHFGPRFKVSTSGHTSRAEGASLDTKVTYPTGPQSNIAKVKVSLPQQLPSRLTTIQKACSDTTFDANPARCPSASLIGAAKATTPILPVSLAGPVYLVSHGGEAFPDIVIALQGYGVRVDLVGSVFISKKGITSTTLQNIPDVPVSSFERYLPQGPHSALAANGDLCASKLKLPTSFVAQDGAQIKQETKIEVTGCPIAKKKSNKARETSHSHTGQRRSK